jgi:hypothetical protein
MLVVEEKDCMNIKFVPIKWLILQIKQNPHHTAE